MAKSFQRCLGKIAQFNKTKKFKMFQEAVMIPIGDWVEDRLRNLSEKDKIRFESRSKSGFGKNLSFILLSLIILMSQNLMKDGH